MRNGLILSHLTLLPALSQPPSSNVVFFALSSVPVLVMAGLCCLATCFFVIVFHTNYRRLRAEEAAAQKAGEEDSPGNVQGAMVENED